MTDQPQQPPKQQPPQSLIRIYTNENGDFFMQATLRTEVVSKDLPEQERALIFQREAPMLLTQLSIVASTELQQILLSAIRQEAASAAQANPPAGATGPKLEKKETDDE